MPHSNPLFETHVRPYGEEAIAEAAALIRDGQCVAVPTETVYGLAADATSGAAVARIYEAKGRPSFNPLIVHVLDLASAERLAIFNDAARELAKSYWPGPITLVLQVRPECEIASLVTAGLSTIAIRVPAHLAMRALLTAGDKPLAAPSANASGTISPTRAEHVLNSIQGRIPLIIDAGSCAVGIESTIVAVGDEGQLRLLRPGPIDLGIALETGGRIEAPGQMLSHYAPSKPLRLNAKIARSGEFHIGFRDVKGDVTLSRSGDLAEAAAALFDCLHQADAAPQPRIAIAPVPDEGLGTPINDRLRRAAA